MVDFNVGVVIVAAGLGTRLGGSIPKQYYKILDKPIMFYALEGFLNVKWITKIALVVDTPDKVENMLQELDYSEMQKVTVVKGENSRHRSIKAGLQELHKRFAEELRVIVVHDGVRPIVSATLIEELVLCAEQHGAAGAVRPLVSTVLKYSQDNFLVESLDRSVHVASETPQAFQLSILHAVYNKCSDEDLDYGTECLHLTQKYSGITAKLIEGPEELWKVTHRKDLVLASSTIKQKHNNVCIIVTKENPTIHHLIESLSFGVATVRHISSICKEATDDNQIYNTVIVFHEQEIKHDMMLNLSSMLDTDKTGLIIHVIDNASIDGLTSMSVYSLHRSGRNMAHHYEKLRKGVVIIHSLSCSEDSQLVDLLTTLIQADPLTFTGQTLFI